MPDSLLKTKTHEIAPKVVVIGLNPAIDLTGNLTSLKNGKVNPILESYKHPAGKGLNVAKVLSNLGAQVTLTGFLGKENASEFTETFNQLGLINQTILVKGMTRINVKLVEKTGDVTDLNFPGFSVTPDDIDSLEQTILALTETHEYFILTGSIPPNFPIHRLEEWIKILNSYKKRVIFDSSRDALRQGIKANPWLIKPNLDELSEWANETILNDSKAQVIAKSLIEQGITHIVLSQGEKGILWVNRDNILSATPPLMKVASTVGAGDTLVAALCWCFLNNYDPKTTLRFATALSALAVTQIGVGDIDIEALKNIEKNVVITQSTY